MYCNTCVDKRRLSYSDESTPSSQNADQKLYSEYREWMAGGGYEKHDENCFYNLDDTKGKLNRDKKIMLANDHFNMLYEKNLGTHHYRHIPIINNAQQFEFDEENNPKYINNLVWINGYPTYKPNGQYKLIKTRTNNYDFFDIENDRLNDTKEEYKIGLASLSIVGEDTIDKEINKKYKIIKMCLQIDGQEQPTSIVYFLDKRF